MGAWQEIVDYTFTANETSRQFTLPETITKDDFVKVVVNIVNVSASANTIGFFPNGETTTTDYHRQVLRANSTSVAAERVNQNRFGLIAPNLTGTIIGYAKLSENNNINVFGNYTSRDDSSIETVFSYTTSTNVTFSSGYTSITIGGNQTSGIGTGSRIQIYKLAAEKVADITVGSNTTQVDISNLSIDKDSEYLLVSDFINSSGSGNELRLTVNDNTTESNYWFQRIVGTDSAASALRTQVPGYLIANGNKRGIGYAHIKLSNIGAYTAQSYIIRNYGESGFLLQNYFVSSIAENITSITKLNIFGSVTTGIGAGSRFMLYKLY